uniref:Uncharacterized protein n=1 Tax=Mycena chlorophos TaxID=658473 RepID=A0ABQ0L542_MYCCL|nr:predicted protein [Mycena chlorophos]
MAFAEAARISVGREKLGRGRTIQGPSTASGRLHLHTNFRQGATSLWSTTSRASQPRRPSSCAEDSGAVGYVPDRAVVSGEDEVHVVFVLLPHALPLAGSVSYNYQLNARPRQSTSDASLSVLGHPRALCMRGSPWEALEDTASSP